MRGAVSNVLTSALDYTTMPTRFHDKIFSPLPVTEALMEEGPRPDAAVARDLRCPLGEVVTTRAELKSLLARIK